MADEITFSITNPEGDRELIMIVDDDALVTLLVERVLTNEGYRIITATDGQNALAIYKKMQDYIALVILDLKMPEMDGITLFSELQAMNPRVRVALTSGYCEQEQLEELHTRGLRGFIPKPLTQQKLILKVRAMLDAIHADDAARKKL
jgi:CheY-like chemotaxis protein